jgi:hypothetical protein
VAIRTHGNSAERHGDRSLQSMSQLLKVKPGTKVRLKDFDPDFHDGLDKEAALDEAAKNAEALDALSRSW